MLNRNEVIQGPSPRVRAALKNFPLDHINFYFPGYEGSALAEELSTRFQVPKDRIIVGYGAEDILRRIFDSLDPARDAVLVNEIHFNYYHLYLVGRGVRMHEFRLIEGEREFHFDIDDCITKIRTLHPKLVLITSPNNPTGNVLTARELGRILRATPAGTLVAIDEAYYGFDPEYQEAAFMALLRRYPNLMFIRTFSKLYALAGLRIGYALCGKKVRTMISDQGRHLGGSRILEAVAIAALRSPAYYRALAKEIARDRDRTIEAVNTLSHFKAFASRANIITIKIASPRAKAALKKELSRAKALIARFYGPSLLRVSVAPRAHMDTFIAMMKRVDRSLGSAH
jgi:histidinol-phosphate aminotransferase